MIGMKQFCEYSRGCSVLIYQPTIRSMLKDIWTTDMTYGPNELRSLKKLGSNYFSVLTKESVSKG